MLPLTLPKPVLPTPATSSVSTSSPIALCLRALNLHTTTRQPANKETEKVDAAIRVALSDQRTEPEAIAIILNNAFVHGYVPELNDMIAQIKKQDTDHSIAITDKVIEILWDDNIALTVKKSEKGEQVVMSRHTATFPSDLSRDIVVNSVLDNILPKALVELVNQKDNRQAFPVGFSVDSSGNIRFNDETKGVITRALDDKTSSQENRNIQKQILGQAMRQNKTSYLGI